jgi:hypothetical protein
MTNMFHRIVDEARDRERERIVKELEDLAQRTSDDRNSGRFVWLDEAIKIIRDEVR